MRPNFLLSIALVILSSTLLSAQCSFPLPPSESGDSCVTSTYLCPLELHEFEGTLPDSININGPSLLCVSGGEANNIQWYRFVVCEEYVELLITPSNCTTINQNGSSFSGMQAGIYSDCDFNELLACVDDGQTSAFTLSGSNFTPGHQVYMFVDGNQGAVCDYKFEIVEGIDTTITQIPVDSTAIATDGMVTGDSDLCTGEGDYGFIPATCTAGGGTQVGCPLEEDTVSETLLRMDHYHACRLDSHCSGFLF